MNDHQSVEDSIITLTGSTFDELVLQGDGPIAVEFMSYSCSHCGMIEPVLQQAAAMLQSKERVYRVNIANDPELAESLRIEGTPTIVLFQGGSEISRVEGP